MLCCVLFGCSYIGGSVGHDRENEGYCTATYHLDVLSYLSAVLCWQKIRAQWGRLRPGNVPDAGI